MSNEGRTAQEWRRAIYGRGAPTRTDLVGLTALAADGDGDLLPLLADVARDALLVEGRISCENADWLMEVCGDGRGLPSYAQFEVLTAVLQHATPAPGDLVAFAAREVERAILTGERAALGGLDGDPGQVTPGDVALLAEIGRAGRPDRALAEVLFDIAHATATADNDPAFDALFAQSLWAYLTGEIPAGEGFHEFRLALDAGAPALEARAPLEALEDSGYQQAAQSAFARCDTASALMVGGAKWALAHLSRGALSPAERRLVAILRDGAADRRHAA